MVDRNPKIDRLARTTRGLMVALAGAVVINLLLVAWLAWHGETSELAFEGTGLLLSRRIVDPTGVDSFRPMLAAYEHDQKFPGSLYWVFLECAGRMIRDSP